MLATIASFALITWISAALLLPHVVRDPNARLGLAGAVGLAVAALAALWGHSFANKEKQDESTGIEAPSVSVSEPALGVVHNVIESRYFRGTAIQGVNVYPLRERESGRDGSSELEDL